MQINFDLTNVRPLNNAPQLIPAGVYLVKIVNEQAQNGALVLEYQILQGDFAGVRLRDWLAFDYEKEAAREMAKRRLKSICEAVGVPNPRDTRELYNRPFMVEVSQAPSKNNGVMRNYVDGYLTQEAAQPQTPQPMQQPQTQPAQQSTQQQSAPFWA